MRPQRLQHNRAQTSNAEQPWSATASTPLLQAQLPGPHAGQGPAAAPTGQSQLEYAPPGGRPAPLAPGAGALPDNNKAPQGLGHRGLSSADIQSLSSGLGGSSSAAASKAGKKKRALGTRSWIVITCTGECSVLEADKGTIMRRCDLPGRDLRLLDPLFVYPSTILGREKAMVVNLETVRCIITADEVLILNTPDPAVQQYKSTLLRRLMLGPSLTTVASSSNNELKVPPWRRDAQGDDMYAGQGYAAEDEELPFEFKALELALEMATSALDFQAQKLCGESFPLLDQLASQISTANLERVRRTKASLLSLTGRVQKVRAEIEQLMDDDGDMAEMYLTEKRIRAEASTASALRPSFPHSSSRHGYGGAPGAAIPAADVTGARIETASVGSLGGFGSVCYSAPASPVGSPSLRGGWSDNGGPASAIPVPPRASAAVPRHPSGSADTAPSARGLIPPGHIGEVGGRASLPWGGVGSMSGKSHSDDSASYSTESNVENVETLEMLLEAYFVVIDGTLNKLTQLSQYIDDTEDFINIQLDNVRNQLIQFELIMTTAAFVVALWGVVAGIFGMNVPLGVEEDPSAFRWILVDSGFGGVLIFVAFLAYFRHKKWNM